MENFPKALFSGLSLFILGFIIGILKAYLRNSPLSKKEEIIQYHQYLKKPVFWSFVSMFLLVLIFGLLMQSNMVDVLKKSTVAGVYTAGAIYVFMIWGANLVKN